MNHNKEYQQVYMFSKKAVLDTQGYGEIFLKDGTKFLYTNYMYEIPVEKALEEYKKYYQDIEFLETNTADIVEHKPYPIALTAQKRIEWSNDIFKNEREYLYYSPSEDQHYGSIIVRTKDNLTFEYTTSFNDEKEIRDNIYNDRIQVGIINRSDIISQEVKNVTLLDRVKDIFRSRKF